MCCNQTTHVLAHLLAELTCAYVIVYTSGVYTLVGIHTSWYVPEDIAQV